MILSFLFFTFLAYLLFRVVFDFVIPVFKTTKKFKRAFREMNERMNQQRTGNTSQPQEPAHTEKTPIGDYIDFEEVKD